jgi:hypothetical protein
MEPIEDIHDQDGDRPGGAACCHLHGRC